MGGLFGKQPNESEGTASQKKASGNKSDEEDLASSSESDLELCKKEEDANKCKSCNTCGGSNTEKQKKKEKKKEKKPEKLTKQLFEILLRKRIFLTDRFEKIEKSLITYGFINGKQLAN